MRSRIAVIGAGYVGLSVAVLLAQHNVVTVLDNNLKKISSIKYFIPPFRDTLIKQYFSEVKSKKRVLNLYAVNTSDDREAALAYSACDYIILALPTDFDTNTGKLDCSIIRNVLTQLKGILKDSLKHITIVIKSTVPIGFTEQISTELDIPKMLVCPEFLREGYGLFDSLYPSRIVVGCIPGVMREAEYFSKLLQQGALKNCIPTFITSASEAESIKVFSNAYLAMRVGFFNELDTLSKHKGMDTSTIIRGICADPRVGDTYNSPSFGYGGYCLPKDTKYLSSEYGEIPSAIIPAIIKSNELRKKFIAKDIAKLAKERNSRLVGFYRLTAKSTSDSLHDSPSLDVMKLLRQSGIWPVVYEPTIQSETYLGFKIFRDLNLFLKEADFIVTNQYSPELAKVGNFVYTRDILRG